MRKPVVRKDRAITPEERMDAREALKILDGSGLRLVDAARVAIGQGKRGATAVPVALACDRFLADRRTAGARPDMCATTPGFSKDCRRDAT